MLLKTTTATVTTCNYRFCYKRISKYTNIGSQATIDSADITTIKNTNFTGSQMQMTLQILVEYQLKVITWTTGGKIYYANVFITIR